MRVKQGCSIQLGWLYLQMARRFLKIINECEMGNGMEMKVGSKDIFQLLYYSNGIEHF